MELSTEEEKIRDESCNYVIEHKQELIERFILSKRPYDNSLLTLFTAGSPGAGKTEFSNRLIPLFDSAIKKELTEKGDDVSAYNSFVIQIDVDEIREFLPHYTKTDSSNGKFGNAHIIQKAANKGLDMLRSYCLKNSISFLHDGTFANYNTMKDIIKDSLKDGRAVAIYYLYIDPVEAWKFTKIREAVEGRNIVKEKFIEQYFNSMRNVDRAKEEFGKDIAINCVLKNNENKIIDTLFNAISIDEYLKTKYNKNLIRRYSEEELSNLLN